jgi:hypothetical protein
MIFSNSILITDTIASSTASSGGNNNNNDGNNQNVNVNVGKSSADDLSSRSKIATGVTVPLVVLALAGFLW